MANFNDVIELRRDRKKLQETMQGILDTAKAEKRDLTQEENTNLDKILSDEQELRGKIERLEKIHELNKDLEGHENRFKADDKEDRQKVEYQDAFKNWLTRGMADLSVEERKLLSENRALSGLQANGSAGGYTVPTGFLNELQKARKFYGGMLNVSRVINTATGNPLPIPTVNDTNNVGEIIAENTQVTNQDVAFGQVTLGAYKYSSKMVLVPIELMQDSAFDIESYLAEILGERIGRINNTHYTTGNGTTQPQGVVTGASAGKVGIAGQTTKFILDDLVDLEHSIDKAYRPKSSFMLNDQTLKYAKKMVDTTGRLIWSAGLQFGQPDTILGYKYEINNDVATMSASAKSILFGDFSNFFIRDVMGVDVIRFGEKFMDYGQVGFLAFSRTDSKLVNAGMNPIAYYQNSAT